MLTGPKLGAALREAIRRKGVSNAEVARVFDVKGPSVYDWLKHGRIGKQHINMLVSYFADVVPPAHWGIESSPVNVKPQRSSSPALTADELDLLSTYRGADVPAREVIRKQAAQVAALAKPARRRKR